MASVALSKMGSTGNCWTFCIAFLSIVASVQGQTCSVFGTDAEERTESMAQGFYLNTQDAATCDGTIDQFEYCYYRSDQPFLGLATYEFTFAVYRETSQGSYEPISNPYLVDRHTGNTDRGFECLTYQLSTTIDVQIGDVIGACIYDPPDLLGGQRQLNVVGQNAGTDRFLMTTDNTGCGEDTVPNPVSSLNVGEALVLHLWANISPLPTELPLPTTQMGTPPPSTTAVSDSSTVAAMSTTTSIAQPAAASTSDVSSLTPLATRGELTSTVLATTAHFETSTLMTSSSSVLMATSVTTVPMTTSMPITMDTSTLFPIATSSPSAAIEATTTTESSTPIPLETPSPTEDTTTATNPLDSFTARSSPMETPLPTMLSTESTPTEEPSSIPPTPIAISTSNTMDITLVSTSTTAVPEIIGPTPAATETTPPATTDVPTTPPINEPQAPGNNAGIIAAVVVVILVLAVAAVATVVGVLMSRRRRRKSVTVTNHDEAPGIGFANAAYSEFTSKYQEIEPKFKDSSGVIVNSGSKYDYIHTYEMTSLSERSNHYVEVGPRQDQSNASSGLYEYTSPVDGTTISYRKLLLKNEEEDIYGSENPYEVPASHEPEIYAQLKTWGVHYIHRSDIEITGHLGSGQFGSVEQGVWKRQGTEPVDVALKSLTKTSEEDKVKFLQEAAIMAQFKHSNVITLHGMVARAEPMMIVVELATRGDLRNFLLSMRPNPREIMPGHTTTTFWQFSQQVALGMQYLSAKGFVHRDLAARNVLVTDNYVCKVADFGLSRNLADETYYVSQGGKIPVKWTAPEAIHYRKYSTASDVWSYGCLLYEIWSLGHKPFEGILNLDTLRMVDSGYRLPPPPGTPRAIYELMINCWHPETSQRLAFRDIVLTLGGSEEMVLNIPEEDSSTNPLAGVLGAPLEAGENMYSELQRRYKK